MITASELRIGNWIASGKVFSSTSVIGKVHEIYNDNEFPDEVYCECDESFEYFFRGKYCGIPLTTEVLEKCKGFKDCGYYFDNGHVIIFKKTMNVEIICSCREGSNVMLDNMKYLHQIQNLIFALTGKELQYTP